MKIITTVRTLNESTHIEKFCKSYSEFADQILVADGGSTDNTVLIAKEFPKVKVRPYWKKVKCEGGIWRNPDGPHIQFLIDWAIREGADWIVHQDCDQRPNKYLKEEIRKILSETDKDFIMVTQIFFWGIDMYLPKLSKARDDWMQGLWAWRANAGIKIIDKMPHYTFSLDGEHDLDLDKSGRDLRILPPKCFMHFGWPTEERVQAHIEYYRNSGLIEGMAHPLQFGGAPSIIKDWMIED